MLKEFTNKKEAKKHFSDLYKTENKMNTVYYACLVNKELCAVQVDYLYFPKGRVFNLRRMKNYSKIFSDLYNEAIKHLYLAK